MAGRFIDLPGDLAVEVAKAKVREPPEPDPGRGWLRSRFGMAYRNFGKAYISPPIGWPRDPPRSACGRERCKLCDDKEEMPL